jgi:precorrin-3B synthase
MTAEADQRRGFCPTVLVPMESGDGLIVRLGVGVRRLHAAELRRLSQLAQSLGNGLIELTRRGKLQLRGVGASTLAALQAALSELGFAEASAYDRRAALVANPLSGLHPDCANLDGLTREIEQALSSTDALRALPDKFGIVLDSGGNLGDITADIRLEVFAAHPERARLSVAHDAHSWTGPSADAARAISGLALALASRAPGRRMRDYLESPGVRAVDHCLEGWSRDAAPRPGSGERPPPIGFQRGLRDWLALGVPFGSGDARLWDAIAELSADFGDGELRITPWRSVILSGISARDRSALLDRARRAGLIADPADPLLRAVACSGAPACGSALGETRGLARELAGRLLPRVSPRARLHVSGCGKSCALDGKADVTLVWDAGGCKLGLDQSVSEATKTDPMTLEAARARLAELPANRDYERDGAAIYRRSFAIIRAEAELGRFSALEQRVAVRLIHACGMVELAQEIEFSPGFAEAAAQALQAGAPILCDTKMLPAGVTRARLPSNNEVLCFLDDPRVPGLAAEQKTTRSAAALSLWREKLAGAVVAVGNAPTALFRLLELLDETPLRPAAVIGVPVGFVGAAESKEALLADGRVPCMIVRGRKGGSAMAVAAINALASDRE